MPSIKELKLICKKAERPKEWQLVHWGEILNRKMTIYLTWFFLHFKITANQITILGSAVNLIGFGLFLIDNQHVHIAAVVIIFFSFLLDGCDGEVARYRKITEISSGDYGLGGAYIEPISHDIQYSFMFLPIGLGSSLVSGSLIPFVAAFIATVSKLLFRLSECRYDMFERYVSKQTPISQELLEGSRQKPRPTLFYFLYRHIFTSSMTVYFLAIAVAFRHVEWFLYFYAVGFLGLWLFKMRQQKKRIGKIIKGL